MRAEIHAQLRERGRTACTWEVGTHATPDDLVERLHALGLVDDEPTSLAVGMVLDREPAARAGGSGDSPRRERRGPARGRAHRGGRLRRADRPRRAATSPSRTTSSTSRSSTDEPAARASASFGELGATLFGGATLPEARGRGAYRALVAARWDDAVARGTPRVVTQAGPMSRPILVRARLPRGVRDSDPGRPVRPGRIPDSKELTEGQRQGRLRAPRGDRARGRRGDGPVKGERIATAQQIPPNFLENILGRPPQRRPRRVARAAPTAATGSPGLRPRSSSPT